MSKRSMTDRLAECVVTFGGLGALPVAGGTWGTLGAAAVHGVFAAWIGTANNPYFLPALALIFSLGCIAYGPWAERRYGKKDPGECVIDEVAGYFLAVSFFPFANQWRIGIVAFIFFRIFDIIKPCPGRRSQKLRAGWGIVADDLIAGLYAALFTRLFWRVF